MRAALAKSDVQSADVLAEHLIQLSVSYARPFMTSRGLGRIPARFQRFPRDRGELGYYHGLVMGQRQTLLAHNDLTPYRGALVLTPGHFGRRRL